MTRHTVYAAHLELVPDLRTEPTYATVADQLTAPDRAALRTALQLLAGWPPDEPRARRLAERLGLVLGLCLLLTGCGQMTSAPETASLARDVRYFWEPQAGLCFAELNSTTHGQYKVTSLAAVPSRACGK